jgi:hypothetical protein
MELRDSQKPDFIALLNYKSTENGGRKTAAHSKYRPLVEFPGLLPLTGGEQTFLDKEIVYPGENVLASIRIMSVDSFLNKLYVGQKFNICEVPGLVLGTGEILELVNKKLEKK